MEENIDYKKILKLQRINFVIRIIFFSIVLAALVYLLLTSGSDPCQRCKLKIDSMGDKEYNCREIINQFVKPNYVRELDNYIDPRI